VAGKLRGSPRIQEELAGQVRTEDDLVPDEVRIIAGADVSYDRARERLYAAICVFSYPELELLEVAQATGPATFPYIPGLLSFREGPIVLAAAESLHLAPQVLLCDGQGIAHPRRLGLASHLGVILDLPTIGCAKSVLIGEWEEPGLEKGSLRPLIYRGEIVGSVLRTRAAVKPMFISPGHRVSIRFSQQLVLSCCRRYRLPEPTRCAHHRVTKMRWEDK